MSSPPHTPTDSPRENNLPDWKMHGYRVRSELSGCRSEERITYLAKDLNADRSVVIKEWRMSVRENIALENPELLPLDYATYLPEIELLQQLDYPNIPRYLNSFPTSTGFCLVRAYQTGVSLAEIGTLRPEEIELIARAVLKTLLYLQQLQPIVIHKNIKPENIIIDKDSNGQLAAHLVDFGLDYQDGFAGRWGTPGFIPPERIFDRQLTSGSDIYSLGMSLICLLTGTPSSQARALLDDRCWPQFHDLVPEHTSPQIVCWLEKMSEPNERRRYPDAASACDPPAIERQFDRPDRTVASISTEPNKSQYNIKFKWWWLIVAALVSIGGLFAQQFLATDSEELSPEAIARNQKIAKQAAFEASDRGRLIVDKKCVNCNFARGDFAKAELMGVVMSQSNLTETNFTNANLTLAILGDADLSKANLSNANLQQAALYGAKLVGANLAGANLNQAKLIYANFKTASLQKANLTDADLKFADLTQANLTNANLTGADLSNADLSEANLRQANLTRTKLDNAKLTGAIMPDGLIHP